MQMAWACWKLNGLDIEAMDTECLDRCYGDQSLTDLLFSSSKAINLSTRYKFHNPEELYFISFATVRAR